MAQSVRLDAGIDLAGMLLDDVQYQRSRYYYFLGGIESWDSSGIDGGPVDVPPGSGSTNDPLIQTNEANRGLRSEIAFVKKIAPNEVSQAARRINWISGNIYDFWDHTQIMEQADFYVLTNEYNVYKCLNNNGGVPSTVKPTGNSIYPFETADGYTWKYMYNIPPFKRSRFTSVGYIPVQKALSDSFYNNGAVDDAVVISGGSGYTGTPSTIITVPDVTPGVTVGSGAVVLSVEIDDGTLLGTGAITDITVSPSGTGTGYLRGVRVVIDGNGKGVGATAHAVIGTGANAGKIMSVVIDTPGYGYDPLLVQVTFEVGGASLLAAVSTETGTILDIIIADPGIGYADNTALTLSVTGTGGTGKYGNPSAILRAVTYDGTVKHVNVIDPGINYPSVLSTFIVVEGDGQNAAFIPIIHNGEIIDVVVDKPGAGYSSINLTVQSGSGTGAVVRGVITQSDYVSDQMVVEQTAVDGAIYHIKVVDGGQNYTPNDLNVEVPPRTIVQVIGNGTGCTARAVIGNTGVIEKIVVMSPGSNYTYANVVITDLDRPGGIIPLGDVAEVYAILPPIGGHGSDATHELFANVLAIGTPLRNEMEIQGIAQEFRTFGIIRNPQNLLTGTRYQNASALLSYKMQFLNTAGLELDELLSLSNNRYRVMSIDADIVTLLPIDPIIPLAPIGTLKSLSDSAEYQSAEAISVIDFDKYSGALLYVSTEPPFTFTADQSLTIKTYVKF